MPTQQDRNANEIVSALREAGCVVRFIEFAHGIAGCPDVLVGRAGSTFLLEIKAKRGRLSDEQVKFHADWRGGTLAVVRSVEDALRAVGLTPAHPTNEGSTP